MSQFDYLIVGSGLFGAVFAHEAAKRGKKCLVIDKRDHIGGNLYCEEIENIYVHTYGAHIFHTSNKKIWSYVNQFCEFNCYINSPIANYKGEIYNLPFNMNTFSKLWNISTPAQAMEIIDSQRSVCVEPQNLEEQAFGLVGEDIYKKLVKGYTEKQWGRDCKELPAFIIKRLPVRFTYDNNYFNDRYQGIPIGGYMPLIQSLLKDVEIRLNIDFNEKRAELEPLADKVVYTGMLDAFYGYQYGPLEYRSLQFETEVLDSKNYQGNAVVNYTDNETPYTRVIEHKHFAYGENLTEKISKTVITKEYPAEYAEGMEPYYPVNDEKNQKILEKYMSLAAKEEKVLFGGRLAQYKYYDMDQVIASALEVVDAEFGAEDIL